MAPKNGRTRQAEFLGTDAPWYQGWDLTEEARAKYRERSKSSAKAKQQSLLCEDLSEMKQRINQPRLDPSLLMPSRSRNGFKTLSLFSGGGGLDLGFDLAGFTHIASYEILPFACETLKWNRPQWSISGGKEGNVIYVDWRRYRGKIDILHGGPPCQPFSTSGRQKGNEDARDMFPEFVRAVKEIEPRAFLAENVPGLTATKFNHYLNETVFQPLSKDYHIKVFQLNAASYGVPEVRTRLFFVGFRDRNIADKYTAPTPTHYWHHLKTGKNGDDVDGQERLFDNGDTTSRIPCMGTREALGIPDIGYDALAPTLRSALTGPRHTTSILSSTSALKTWNTLKIWPNGVGLTRERASNYPAQNGHFRLSVPDCGILQGFPESWRFDGPVYKALGQIGNAVAPPVAYWLAVSFAQAFSLSSDSSTKSRNL